MKKQVRNANCYNFREFNIVTPIKLKMYIPVPGLYFAEFVLQIILYFELNIYKDTHCSIVCKSKKSKQSVYSSIGDSLKN